MYPVLACKGKENKGIVVQDAALALGIDEIMKKLIPSAHCLTKHPLTVAGVWWVGTSLHFRRALTFVLI